MIEQLLEECLRNGPINLGELVVREVEPGRFVIRHWKDDESQQKLAIETSSIAALEIVRYDEQGNYRALKGAPNLRTGWELRLESVPEVRQAIDYFYPGAFSTWLGFNRGEITPIDLRQTLTRQTGMYRVTQRLADFQAERFFGQSTAKPRKNICPALSLIRKRINSENAARSTQKTDQQELVLTTSR